MKASDYLFVDDLIPSETEFPSTKLIDMREKNTHDDIFYSMVINLEELNKRH